MPSLYEGFPVTIIESLASGVPCVLSDTITKEVQIIEKSIVFRNLNDNIDDWCESILKVSQINLNRDVTFEILKEKGLSIDKTVKRLEELYDTEN